MQAGHGVLQSGESRAVPSSTGSNSNLSKAWGPRPTSNVPALSESTHKPGVCVQICTNPWNQAYNPWLTNSTELSVSHLQWPTVRILFSFFVFLKQCHIFTSPSARKSSIQKGQRKGLRQGLHIFQSSGPDLHTPRILSCSREVQNTQIQYAFPGDLLHSNLSKHLFALFVIFTCNHFYAYSIR